MGLFGKNNCSVCGGKTGMLGGKKLSDGTLCKECSKKLSPWFDGYKQSSVSDIRDQLEAREENRRELEQFDLSMVFGEFGAILIDERAKKFLVIDNTSDHLFGSAQIVTSLDQVIDRNPDIIDFSQVRDVDIEIRESKREEKQSVNGEQISYDPKHYLYMMSFEMKIEVEHPYIHTIRVKLNNGTVQIHNVGERLKNRPMKMLAEYMLGLPVIDVKTAALYDNNSLRDRLLRNPYEMPDYAFGFRCSLRNQSALEEYAYFLEMVRIVREILLGPDAPPIKPDVIPRIFR